MAIDNRIKRKNIAYKAPLILSSSGNQGQWKTLYFSSSLDTFFERQYLIREQDCCVIRKSLHCVFYQIFGLSRRRLLSTFAGLAMTTWLISGQADTIKIRTYDDKGPVDTNIELVDLAKQDTTSKQTKEGTAIFPLDTATNVGVHEATGQGTTIAPNPIEHQAFFKHNTQGKREHAIEAYNLLGQLLDR